MRKEEVAATDAMVNMDTLGLTLPEVWASPSEKQLGLSVLRLDDYYQTYRVIGAYLVFLDQVAGAPSTPGPH